MTSCENAVAVNELLQETDTATCVETLDDFFECWLTHGRNDTTSVEQRTDRYYSYKFLRKLLTLLEAPTNSPKGGE